MGAIAPKGFTRRYGNTLAARIGIVGRDGLDACVYKNAAAPENKAPPAVTKAPRPLPGEEYETATPPPAPTENAVEASPVATEPERPETPVQNTSEPAPTTEQPQEPANGV